MFPTIRSVAGNLVVEGGLSIRPIQHKNLRSTFWRHPDGIAMK